MKISVIIPVYNRKNFIKRSLASVLNQSFKPLEIIIVDDGSTDGLKKTIARSNAPEIKYIFQENKGVAAARNTGIKAAGSDWISFLDSDDEWKKDKLLKQAEYLENNPHIKICHTNEIWIRDGKFLNQKKKHKKEGGQIFERCLKLCLISPSAVIIKKDLFEKYGAFDESFPACEDYDMWLRLTAKEKIGFIEEPLIIKYGGHNDQLSKTVQCLDKYRIKALKKILKNLTPFSSDYAAAKKELALKQKIYTKGALKRGK